LNPEKLAMPIPRWLIVLIAALVMGSPLFAADLTELARVLVKEPAYKSKPRYCLLVFGPEAKTRVWLVHDGDTLYVDRNGNGDLTDVGESVSAKVDKRIAAEPGIFDFEAGDLAERALLHKGLSCTTFKVDHLADTDPDVEEFLAKHADGRAYILSIDVEMPGEKGAGLGGRVEQLTGYHDVNGLLMFAERPADAPIVHFRGPLTVSLFDRQQLTIGRQKQLGLAVGTPGLGPGTTALVGYDDFIPRDVFPRVEIEFPPERDGSAPLRERYELKGRC
jgi:hypothetical protein